MIQIITLSRPNYTQKEKILQSNNRYENQKKSKKNLLIRERVGNYNLVDWL